MNNRRVTPTVGAPQVPRPSGPAKDYDVTATLADGTTRIYKSRASSSTLALRLAVDNAIREVRDVIKLEVVL